MDNDSSIVRATELKRKKSIIAPIIVISILN